jgi:nicotinic acid phosphoribosyltransferase
MNLVGLRSGKFSNRILGALRFRGDVHAMPEGTVFFANEPIPRVTAPLPEAQLAETHLINALHFQTRSLQRRREWFCSSRSSSWLISGYAGLWDG